MRKILLLTIVTVLTILSCKKNKDNNTAFSLNNTAWQLYFRSNPTFNFYAHSTIYFKDDYTFYNYRNSDTLLGTWELKDDKVSIYFRNSDVYKGNIISNDSLAGTLTSFGGNGNWYATR